MEGPGAQQVGVEGQLHPPAKQRRREELGAEVVEGRGRGAHAVADLRQHVALGTVDRPPPCICSAGRPAARSRSPARG
eukprot:8032577-Lingulodinium_polyedra.AAC.1